MDIILFGMQGSGKGTQGQMLAQKFDFKIFETGAALRRLANTDSELGHKIKRIIESGQLVPDEIVMEIIENFLALIPYSQKVIFDGIPRKISQAHLFNKLMQKVKRDPIGLHIKISRAEAILRLTARQICPKCKTVYGRTYEKNICEKCGEKLIRRADDNEESIKTRIELFEKETLPVIAEFEGNGKMITVDGKYDVEIVFGDIKSKLQNLV